MGLNDDNVPMLRVSNEAGNVALTLEMVERAKQHWLARTNSYEPPRKLRVLLSDQTKQLLVSVDIDPAEAFDLIEPITWSELMEENPLDDATIE